MTVRRLVAAVAALAAALPAATACGSQTPDYRSIWSTTPSNPAPTSTAPPEPVPFSQYLEQLGVRGEPVPVTGLDDLTVTLPRPTGWGPYTNPNLSPQTAAIARDNDYPTAMVLVFRLHGGFDVAEAIRHATADALLSPGFTRLNESLDDFDGFPSAMIEGSYDVVDRRLHSYNRIVIPVTPAPDFQRYLVQFTVTSLANQAVAASGDIQQIIDGFSVAVR